jgi:lysine 6-dehydrogenase
MDSWIDYILLIGAGAMGRAIAWDLRNREPKHRLTVLDRDGEALRRLSEFVGGDDVQTVVGDAEDMELVKRLMSRATAGIGATSYHYAYEHAAMAVQEGAHWVDLGGNNDVVRRQFTLDEKARQAGVAVIPDSGLAPGMVNIIVGDLLQHLDNVDEIHIRVGGLPQNPKPPLFYGLVFSPEGLANEYFEPALVIEDGELRQVPSLTGWERVYVGAPLGTLEAFHTSGGSSTMVETLLGRVKTLDYKTLRYPGHLQKIKLLLDLGLFDKEEVEAGGVKVAPRKLLGTLLERLGWVADDLVVVKVWGEGTRDGKRIRRDYTIIDYADITTGLTAMARTTGFPAAILARMLVEGKITARGVLRQEESVPPELFIAELARRGIKVGVSES